MLLGYQQAALQRAGGLSTAAEINQQPPLWRELFRNLCDRQGEIAAFLQPILQKENLRIILAGAGSSAFIGNSSAGYLRHILQADVEAIDTTSIVAAPQNYFLVDRPTLLVSHSRSGDSPESVATVEIARKMIKELYLINITCNKDGAMAREALAQDVCLSIIMPAMANDRGFAMTSSFTTMLLTDLLLPHVRELASQTALVEKLAAEAEKIIVEKAAAVASIVDTPYDRLVFIGSGPLLGCAMEGSLKTLELTRGGVNVTYNTTLGFRHGPKSVINDNTLLGFFVSTDPYTQKYDLDLIREIAQEAENRKILVVSPGNIDIPGITWQFVLPPDLRQTEPAFLTPLYVMYAQLLAFFKSLGLGITPDNPWPEGNVNRVVKGVTIYDYTVTGGGLHG